MSHRALITGVSGFVGGFLAQHLIAIGDTVLGCSPDGEWTKASPEDVGRSIDLVAWDMTGTTGINDRARQTIERFAPTCIYHLAAISVPAECGQGTPTDHAVAINVGGTSQVIELAGSIASKPRVLFVSSSHVYARVDAKSPVVRETAAVLPKGGYGATKLAAEKEIQKAVKAGVCDAVIARAFQHTGPRQGPKMMLPEWARQFALGIQPVEVRTRNATIDLTDVRDVVRAYHLLMERGSCGEIYNVGSGIARSSGEVLELLRLMADPNRQIKETNQVKKQDPIANIDKLVRCTNWRAQIPLEKTVADTLAYWADVVDA